MRKTHLKGLTAAFLFTVAFCFCNDTPAMAAQEDFAVYRNSFSINARTRSAIGPGQAASNEQTVQGQITTQGETGAVQDAIFGGAALYMLDSQSGDQMLSCIIQTTQGKLIVIDGGWGTDSAKLLNQLWALGGHVGAWLVTHPHGDHVGALYEILEYEDRNLVIDGIYYSLAEPAWYTQNDPNDAEMGHALIHTLSGITEIPHSNVWKGQEIWVDDVKIDVLNGRYEIIEDSGNNAGVVYKVTVNGKTIVFLGDMGEAGGEYLLAECGDNLKADIVQMAHHGQNGVGERVYQAINPSICLWPTPKWLWDNDNGSGSNTGNFRTGETKVWMNRINESILHYATKDGDVAIY